ncbi:MAG: PIG-L family deacetylase, partial [Gemmatimonadales bacterium]
MRELAKLGHYKRVLMIGAHPDDEDTELLTILSRGEGDETAYLSLTRGEGGQDLIGPELGDALGILRTEELLAARRIDGSQQFFSRAYDFGFSKTIDDAWKHWPQDSILKDVVRIIRRFRPQIVVSVFSGTPRDGHGQHQVAGWAAKRAFEVAGDSTVFPELKTEEGLDPWTPLKLYRSARFDPGAQMISFDGGAIDAVTGKTFRQLAMAGRSLHRSQKMGQLQPIGPSTARVTLWEDRTGTGTGGFWAGVDTTLAGWPIFAAGPRTDLVSTASALRRFGALLDTLRHLGVGQDIAQHAYLVDSAWVALDLAIESRLVGSKSATEALQSSAHKTSVLPVLWHEPAEVQDEDYHLLELASVMSGTMFDAITSRQRAAPGDSMLVSSTVWNGGTRPINAFVGLYTPADAPVSWTGVQGGDSVRPGAAMVESGWATLSSQVPITTPYFLRSDRVGAMYSWVGVEPRSRGLPFERPWLQGYMNLGAAPFATLYREATARLLDPATGEIRRPIFIVPRVSVKLTPDEILLPLGKGSVAFTVTLEHGAEDATSGEVHLELPDGWSKPAPRKFTLTTPDQTEVVTFQVRPPERVAPATFTVNAVAVDSKGAEYRIGTFVVDYPHIHPRQYTRAAEARVVVADLTLP